MRTVFVFGNPIVKEDSVALKIADALEGRLENTGFFRISSLEEIKKMPKELLILDCAEGIQKIEIITDLKRIGIGKKISLHDFDLAAELLLWEKIGKLKGVEMHIIAVPQKMGLEKAIEMVKTILLSKNA